MIQRDFPVGIPPGFATPSISEALRVVIPELILAAWRDLAADSVDTGDYLARLTLQDALQYPFGNDPDAVAVVNTSDYAYWIEHGRAGFHLPSRWGTGGGKWIMGKNGPYARVPFRIFTPVKAGGGVSTRRGRLGATMPPAVHALAKQLPPRGRLGELSDENIPADALYRQSKSYIYYRQVFENFPPEIQDVGGYTWKAQQFEGMFQAGVRNTPGGGTQSTYMTIRTIKPDSPGWYIPPTKGEHYAERAIEQVSPQIADLLDAAAARDIALGIAAAVGEFA